MHIALTHEGNAPGLAVVLVKETDIHARGVTGEDGDRRATFNECGAERASA
jgi:hypothetical protein